MKKASLDFANAVTPLEGSSRRTIRGPTLRQSRGSRRQTILRSTAKYAPRSRLPLQRVPCAGHDLDGYAADAASARLLGGETLGPQHE